jgi:small subunit ribosomal protein S4
MRKLRKKFKRPKVSWDSDLIKENKQLSDEYGLRRRKEILISHEILRGFRQRARQLIAEKDEGKEKTLMDKLARLGLLTGEGKELDDVLALTVKNVLDRRLQTIIFSKGITTSPKHARQLIVHGHVKIDGRKVKFPSYLVPVDEEKGIEIVAGKPRPKKPKEAPAQKDEGKAAEKASEEKPAAATEEKAEGKDEAEKSEGKGEAATKEKKEDVVEKDEAKEETGRASKDDIKEVKGDS